MVKNPPARREALTQSLGQEDPGAGHGNLLQYSFFKKRKKFIYFLAALALRCCMGFSPVAVSRGCPVVRVHRLFSAVASCCRAHGLQ